MHSEAPSIDSNPTLSQSFNPAFAMRPSRDQQAAVKGLKDEKQGLQNCWRKLSSA